MTRKNQIYGFIGFILLMTLQTTLATNLKTEELLIEPNVIPDEDFGTLLGLLTKLLVTNRAAIKSLQTSVENIQETMQELKLRVEHLENVDIQLNNTIIQTQEQVASLSSNLNSLQSTAITNLKLGVLQANGTFDNFGYIDEYGYVITSVRNWDTDWYIDEVSRRKIQVQVNGKWVDIYQD